MWFDDAFKLLRNDVGFGIATHVPSCIAEVAALFGVGKAAQRFKLPSIQILMKKRKCRALS